MAAIFLLPVIMAEVAAKVALTTTVGALAARRLAGSEVRRLAAASTRAQTGSRAATRRTVSPEVQGAAWIAAYRMRTWGTVAGAAAGMAFGGGWIWYNPPSAHF